ncbi:MAG: hypothetical protein A3G66_04560 [Candidatus Levybacteria bacterium RIFCSPLOWO2_12_FULL_39_17]|nr:MAG: HlyD family secretion protein [Candidatus Levybacteria bacterium GW2011_GWA1_39_11]OGH48617.1 MAG: hypothetical protein A3G66_04560 [Candidatus Levybacteria bacterium RIFCSPLOWO2_12_FULL_39_17]
MRIPSFDPEIISSVMKRKWMVAASIILTMLLIPLVLFLMKKPEAETATVRRGSISQELSLSGEIDADEKATLSFQTGGLVAFVGFKKGDFVNQFQAIAALDQRSAKKTLEKTLTDYLLQRSEFDQVKEENLNRTPEQAINNEMKRILERNQWNLDLAVNSVELQDLVIQLSTISTPISGILTEANTPHAGVNVGPFAPQYTIINPKTIYFKVAADQTEVVSTPVGASGTIVLDSYPDKTISGKVSDVSFTPRVGETGTVYDVKVLLNIDNSNFKYLLGMTGDITFTTFSKSNLLSLPVRFVKTDARGRYVFEDPGKKKKKYIETGLESDELIEVRGIAEGAIVYD